MTDKEILAEKEKKFRRDEIHYNVLTLTSVQVIRECESYNDAPDHIKDICACSHLSIKRPITLKQLNLLRKYLEEREIAGTRTPIERK